MASNEEHCSSSVSCGTSNMNFYCIAILATVLAAMAHGTAAGVIPAAAAPLVSAPLVAAPAAIGYTKAVPYNVPPYASRVDISTRALAAPLVSAAAPLVASPAFAAAFAPAFAHALAPPSAHFIEAAYPGAAVIA